MSEENIEIDYTKVRESIRQVCSQPGYDDNSAGPIFVRLGWHASGSYAPGLIPGSFGTGGSNGGGLLLCPLESQDPSNAGLTHAVSFLQPVKKKFPRISYADLFTLASVEAIAYMGGPIVAWQPGRTDFVGKSSEYRDDVTGRLPDGSKGAQHIREIFYRMGFSDQEIVALCGAHSIGRCHTDRSGFDGPWTSNPTRFSNMYYRLLLSRDWKVRDWDGPKQYQSQIAGISIMMLESDMALVRDPEFKKYVEKYAKSQQEFFKDFAAAFAKLLELGIERDEKGQALLKKKIKEAEKKTNSNLPTTCPRSKL